MWFPLIVILVCISLGFTLKKREKISKIFKRPKEEKHKEKEEVKKVKVKEVYTRSRSILGIWGYVILIIIILLLIDWYYYDYKQYIKPWKNRAGVANRITTITPQPLERIWYLAFERHWLSPENRGRMEKTSVQNLKMDETQLYFAYKIVNQEGYGEVDCSSEDNGETYKGRFQEPGFIGAVEFKRISPILLQGIAHTPDGKEFLVQLISSPNV
ncbi:MAG: hypothetical protein AB1643_02605 [Patescibacteria group bacterium]